MPAGRSCRDLRPDLGCAAPACIERVDHGRRYAAARGLWACSSSERGLDVHAIAALCDGGRCAEPLSERERAALHPAIPAGCAAARRPALPGLLDGYLAQARFG